MLADQPYWAIDGLVLAGPWPDSFDHLHAAGVTALVNLTMDSYTNDRFAVHHIPIVDYVAPDLTQVEEFCQLVERTAEAAERLYVHCFAGCGRTGTMVACLFVARHQMSADAAIEEVRRLRPCSIETDIQADAVTAWESLLRDGTR